MSFLDKEYLLSRTQVAKTTIKLLKDNAEDYSAVIRIGLLAAANAGERRAEICLDADLNDFPLDVVSNLACYLFQKFVEDITDAEITTTYCSFSRQMNFVAKW